MSINALLAAAGGEGVGYVPVFPALGYEIEQFVLNQANYKVVRTVTTTAGTSISDAIVAMQAALPSSYDSHPNDRGLLIINPGTYTQRIDRSTTGRKRIDMISPTLDPSTVKIINPDGNEDCFEVSSSMGITVGIHFRSDYSGPSSAAAVHMGDSFTGADQFVFHKCIMENTTTASALSWGANSGQSLFLSQCSIRGPGFFHNFVATRAATFAQFAETVIADPNFLTCLDEAGHVGDTMNVIKGTFPVGYGYSAGGSAGNRTWSGKIDPAAGPVPVGSPFTAGVAPYVSPITDDTYWNNYWFPDQRGVPLTQDLFTVSGNQACVANRIYYVPFRVPSAHNSGSARWIFATPSGNLQASLMMSTDAGLPGPTIWNPTSMPVVSSTVFNGFSRVLVPGELYWLAYSVDNATAVGSRGTVPAGTRYLDVAPGTPITANPAGTLVASGNALAATMVLV